MTIKDDAFRLFTKISGCRDREEIKSVVGKLKSSTRGYGSKIYPSPILGLLLWQQESIKEFSGKAPVEELLLWGERERNMLFALHREVLRLNDLCLSPLKSELPGHVATINPYSEYDNAESSDEFNNLLYTQEDAALIADSFAKHPGFEQALSNLERVRQNAHYDHYEQHFDELFTQLYEAGAGGEVKWVEQYRRSKRVDDLDEVFVSHLISLICLRNAISNLDQLIYQAIFQTHLSHLDQTNIVDYTWTRGGGRLGVWTMYLPTGELHFIEPTDLVLVSLDPTRELRDWVCTVVQLTRLGGSNDCHSIEMIRVDENLDSYGDLLHLHRKRVSPNQIAQ